MTKEVTFLDAENNRIRMTFSTEEGLFDFTYEVTEKTDEPRFKPRTPLQEELLALVIATDLHSVDDDEDGFDFLKVEEIEEKMEEVEDEDKEYIADSKVEDLPVEEVIRYIEEELYETDEDTITKLGAIAIQFELTLGELSSVTEGRNGEWKIEGSRYLVATDEEADAAWDESLESYLEENVLGEIPENLQCYFDREHWKKDAKMDGRGHSLSSCDGDENESEFNGTTIYFYRR